jgi:hypothetical protein
MASPTPDRSATPTAAAASADGKDAKAPKEVKIAIADPSAVKHTLDEQTALVRRMLRGDSLFLSHARAAADPPRD